MTIPSQASAAAAVGGAALVLQAELSPRQAGLRMVVDTLTEAPAGSGVA
ncbi:hypothetical protein [Cellulomonas dongxiuzhuiae]|uniref:Uncharacterized protein n=1 Tax=Cellulomonas dongxiuzhuiae TaxID=2819979 RepID=A0ABX8GN17_9CELL|nr:hypothetical protein [Cellulomonas dongxiuzhuiae]MBO3095729.1 hypothetical protein [Cellulomonas dongxiuzhuiae]QWC17047.1 hypothetical protein KKR89_05395 [Cellulomonas dongxiuzhuiae]